MARDPEKNRENVRRHYYRHRARVIARVTRNRKRQNIERRVWVNSYKRERGCAHCGEHDPVCLQFHHTGSQKKYYAIAKKVLLLSLKRLMVEIAKCIILCANCHLKEHTKLRATGGTADAPGLEPDALVA